MKCRAYAGSLSTGLECNREEGHPGMHRDNYVNAYWMPGAPPLDAIELPTHSSER